MVPVRVRTWCRTGVGMRSRPATPSALRSSRTEDLVAELRAPSASSKEKGRGEPE